MTDIDFEELESGPTNDQLAEVTALAQELISRREEIEYLSAKLREQQAYERELSQEKLPEKMREIGITEFTLEGGTKLSIRHKVKASITKAKQHDAFQWLRDNGHGALIKERVVEEHVHHSTVAAFCREQLSKGAALPLNLFSVYEFDETIIK